MYSMGLKHCLYHGIDTEAAAIGFIMSPADMCELGHYTDGLTSEFHLQSFIRPAWLGQSWMTMAQK
jgi:hypothetical protein